MKRQINNQSSQSSLLSYFGGNSSKKRCELLGAEADGIGSNKADQCNDNNNNNEVDVGRCVSSTSAISNSESEALNDEITESPVEQAVWIRLICHPINLIALKQKLIQFIKDEFESWQRRCNLLPQDIKQTVDILKVLPHCDKLIFPNIHRLHQILGTLPVSSCESERSFSSLAYLKSKLRSTMRQERLTGLAALCIHKDIPINVDAVMDEYVAKDNRLHFKKSSHICKPKKRLTRP